MPEWVKYTVKSFALGNQLQSDNSTLTECQRVCELNPSCVSVDWVSNSGACYINTHPNHQHHRGDADGQRYGVHYHLFSRCNITEGQCPYDVVTFATHGISKVVPVCLSVCLSNACIVTKRKTFYTHILIPYEIVK